MCPKNKKIFFKAGLTSTMENYGEMIYALSQKDEAVRFKDIANNLIVRMPTVTTMLKNGIFYLRGAVLSGRSSGQYLKALLGTIFVYVLFNFCASSKEET